MWGDSLGSLRCLQMLAQVSQGSICFNYFSITVTILTFVFVVIALDGCDGQVPWTIMREDVDTGCGPGYNAGLLWLREITLSCRGQITIVNYSELKKCKQYLSDKNNDGTKRCDVCRTTGKATLAFLWLGFTSILAILTLQISRLAGVSIFQGKGTTIASVAILSNIFFFLSWVIWVGGCHKGIGGSTSAENGQIVDLGDKGSHNHE
ncbi:hypothetical protein AAMO2058_000506900 [Amorphochlora amoebiformis]